MAMTACFAGPVFNMLVGTGVGFSVLLNAKDEVRGSRRGLYFRVGDTTERKGIAPGDRW